MQVNHRLYTSNNVMRCSGQREESNTHLHFTIYLGIFYGSVGRDGNGGRAKREKVVWVENNGTLVFPKKVTKLEFR